MILVPNEQNNYNRRGKRCFTVAVVDAWSHQRCLRPMFLGHADWAKKTTFSRKKRNVKSKRSCRWLDHVRYVIQWQCEMIWFHSARGMTWLNMLFVTNVLLMASWENAKRFSLVVSLMSNRQNKTCNQQTWRLALAWMYEVKKMKDTSARITSWEDF